MKSRRLSGCFFLSLFSDFTSWERGYKCLLGKVRGRKCNRRPLISLGAGFYWFCESLDNARGENIMGLWVQDKGVRKLLGFC